MSVSPVTSTLVIRSDGTTAPARVSSARTATLPAAAICVGSVAVAVPMYAVTSGSTATKACGTPIEMPPPPEAVAVASASARPIAVTRTSPAIPTGAVGVVKSPICTASPIHAAETGLEFEVTTTVPISITPPPPITSVALAAAPAIRASTVTS